MSFSVTILGSSSALPTSKRYLTAHLVNHDERFFLIDCGEGTQMQLRRFHQKIARINHVFISHLHGDHVYGLFGFIATLAMLGRTADLNIYANQKLEDILNSIFGFFDTDLSFKVKVNPTNAKKQEVIYEDDKLEVITLPLRHRIPCTGFLFREKPKLRNIRKDLIPFYNIGIRDIVQIKQGADFITEEGKLIKNEQLTSDPHPSKSYAYITDTKYSESILPSIENVDLLYHESTFLDKDAKLAKLTYHSTAVQAATMAKKANAKKLILGHFSSRYKDDSQFIAEAVRIFENTVMAEDGMEISI
jgi:ribonuclease Z